MIEVLQVALRAGRFRLRDLSLVVPPRRYGVLMGPTGCGKTTLLEAVIGLRRVEAGEVRLNGADVTRCRPAERGVGYVPQDGALFATMTVRRHLAFALEIRRAPASDVSRRVSELAGALGIRHLLDRTPQGLSGGERQRVALGRALSFRPAILLLDEPLSAVDDETRGSLIALLKQVTRDEGVTTLHVTHSRHEADRLADALFLMRDGRIDARHLT
jgi:ABC-type sugar transport system ATPase subunit